MKYKIRSIVIPYITFWGTKEIWFLRFYRKSGTGHFGDRCNLHCFLSIEYTKGKWEFIRN